MPSAPWGLSDIMALPEPEAKTDTRTFEAGGRSWDITIRADAAEHADLWYAIMEALGRAAQEAEPLVFRLPDATEIRVTNKGYLGTLAMMELVGVSPALKAEEWAAWGHKVGPVAMEDVTNWAAEVNGIDAHLRRKFEAAKNALSAGTSVPPSPAHASNSSATSPSARSGA